MAEQVSKRAESAVPTRREDVRDSLSVLRERMDRMMDEFFTGFSVMPFPRWDIRPFEWRMSSFSPSIDIKDEENQIRVEAELPGMTEKDVDISLTRDSLVITGEKKLETEEKERDYYRMERAYGSFQRTIPLPIDVEQDRVEATFKNGLLSIVLPKSQEAIKKARKIEVKAQ
jgi:HSP20 family protein